MDELQELVRHSSGLLPDAGCAWRLNWLTGLLLSHLEAQTGLSKQVKALVAQHPDYAWIASVPYAGPERSHRTANDEQGRFTGLGRIAEASISEEPGAGKPHAGICAEAVGQLTVLPRWRQRKVQ
ncbi:MAG: hypothetical protein JXA14_06150 [Anaerolineae bacterium]|nr:hypothetical protein [Anaerolineae bacterium]